MARQEVNKKRPAKKREICNSDLVCVHVCKTELIDNAGIELSPSQAFSWKISFFFHFNSQLYFVLI